MISVRMSVLMMIGTTVAVISYRQPEIGVALGVAVVVVALLHELMERE